MDSVSKNLLDNQAAIEIALRLYNAKKQAKAIKLLTDYANGVIKP